MVECYNLSKSTTLGQIMRKTLFAAVLLFAGCTPALATDAGSCYAITDADARAYCLAKARRDSGACYTIQSSALRSQCLAEVRR